MKKILQNLNNLEEYFLVYTLAFSVIIVFIQVIMRYCFQNSLSWSEEVARYLFLWISWIGASYAVRENSHFRVEILANMVKGSARNWFELIILLIWFIFCVFLTFWGAKVTYFIWIRQQVSAALQMPMAYAYASVPVGCALMAIRVILDIKKTFIKCLGRC